jgi:hypothetical protein
MPTTTAGESQSPPLLGLRGASVPLVGGTLPARPRGLPSIGRFDDAVWLIDLTSEASTGKEAVCSSAAVDKYGTLLLNMNRHRPVPDDLIGIAALGVAGPRA